MKQVIFLFLSSVFPVKSWGLSQTISSSFILLPTDFGYACIAFVNIVMEPNQKTIINRISN